jgi:DNA-binding Xre family transcriptional regulator
MIIYKEKVVIYMISYIKLVKKLRENNISQYKLKQEKILGSATITKIFRNDGLNGESIDIKVVDKMCKLLNCQPGDILECVEDIEGYSDTSERKYRG